MPALLGISRFQLIRQGQRLVNKSQITCITRGINQMRNYIKCVGVRQPFQIRFIAPPLLACQGLQAAITRCWDHILSRREVSSAEGEVIAQEYAAMGDTDEFGNAEYCKISENSKHL
jgi:hypothetical protein